MDIRTDKTVVVGWVVGKFQSPRWMATFIVKGTYRLRVGETVLVAEELEELSGDRFTGEGPRRVLHYPSDFLSPKPRADAMVVGTAYAPEGQPVRELGVRFAVGELSKTLRVVGDRRWPLTSTFVPQPATALPFVSMPLTYREAFGGAGFGGNPAGRGATSDNAPNVEPLDGVVSRSPGTGPAGFGPLDCTWDQRRLLLGTYDDSWLRERWPWFPDDFDSRYFNAAPADQQVDGFLRGDDAVLLQNLHREHAIYRSALPGLRARCFVKDTVPVDQPRIREVALRLDTLWIDADTEALVLVWHGQLEVSSLKAKELEAVYAGTEQLSEEARPLAFYESLLMPSDTEEESEEEVAERAASAQADIEFDQEIAALRQHFDELDVEQAQIEREAAAEQAELLRTHRDRLVKEGLELRDPESLDHATPPPPESPLAFPEARSRAPDGLDYDVAMAAEMLELERMEKEMDEFGEEFEGDDEALTREGVVALLASGGSLAGAVLEKLDLSALDFGRADLSNALMAGCNLAESNLEGCNLAAADLTNVNLTGADLRRAVLDDASLRGATATAALFAGASLRNATLVKMDLAGLDFSGCSAEGVDFSGSDLRKARFVEADLPSANLQKADLSQASFHRAVLRAAQLNGALGPGVDMDEADVAGMQAGDGADFSGGTFRRIAGSGAIFEAAVLTGANFSRANLARAQFGDATLRDAIFDRADLSDATFDDADLRGASLTNANLLRALFERADLTAGSLAGSNCDEAGFWEALVSKVDIRGANLKGTVLG